MNQAELNNTWTRWLDRRPVSSDAMERLVDELEDNDLLLQRLLDDMDIHRQLEAIGKLDEDDFSFVGRMLVRFESEQVTPPPQPSKPVTTNQPNGTTSPGAQRPVTNGSPVAPGPDDLAMENDAPVASPIHINTAKVAVADKSRSWTRYWAVAVCVPLLAASLFAAYELGRRANQTQTATPSSATKQPGDSEKSLADKQGATNVNQPESIAEKDPIEKRKTDPLPKMPKGRESRVVKDSSKPESELNDRAPVNDGTFAKVINDEDNQWLIRPARWPRVETGAIRLASGTVTLEFDKGGEVTITGPADVFIDRDKIDVQTGRLAFVLPDFERDEMTVLARSNRIIPTSVARFDLNVDDQLADVQLKRGAIEVNPWHGRVVADPMELSEKGSNRLRIKGHTGDQPAVARLSGSEDKFEGWVNFQGRILKSTDPQLLDDVFQRARNEYQRSPRELAREWAYLTDYLNVDSPNNEQPGKVVPPGMPPEFEEMRERMRQMMEKMRNGEFDGMDGNFQGGFSFTFDGEKFHFEGRDMPVEMRDQLLGPFADLAEELKQKNSR